jgi:hypothetical protein
VRFQQKGLNALNTRVDISLSAVDSNLRFATRTKPGVRARLVFSQIICADASIHWKQYIVCVEQLTARHKFIVIAAGCARHACMQNAPLFALQEQFAFRQPTTNSSSGPFFPSSLPVGRNRKVKGATARESLPGPATADFSKI